MTYGMVSIEGTRFFPSLAEQEEMERGKDTCLIGTVP